MCGVCGVVRPVGAPVEPGVLERACAAMRHRGPDDSGTWTDAALDHHVGLGVVRLAVLDPSPAARQPMHRADGRFHIAFNGEIYNFRALRRDLAHLGDRFVTDGDTEVLLAACARWGWEALHRLSGMWAFAFFDSRTRCGLLARDRFGIKPLFYASGRDPVLTFASELRALLLLGGVDRSLNPTALRQHLQFGYIAHPDTIYAGARRLAPGHYVAFDADGPAEPVRYYHPVADAAGRWGPAGAVWQRHDGADGPAAPASAPALSAAASMGGGATTNVAGDTADATGRASHADHDAGPASRANPADVDGDPRRCAHIGTAIRRVLGASVVSRLVADVPMGTLLSGGLDSSIVVAHMAEATGRAVRTFSVGYADQSAYDETRYARLVAERFGTEHHELRLTRRDVLAAIPHVLDHVGEPVGDSSIIPTSVVCRYARSLVTVALSGDAGDELFGGYWRYLGHSALATYSRIPRLVREFVLAPLLAAARSGKSTVAGDRVRQFRKLLRPAGFDAFARHIAWSRILSPEANDVMLPAGETRAADARAVALARSLTAGMPRDDTLNRILAFDLQYALPADMLQKVDLASMMHGLELRVPFLDPAVTRLALSLPSRLKIDRGLRKRVLVDAYRGVLPDDVLDRPKKGFEVPIGEYLRGPLADLFHDTVTRDAVASLGVLSYDGVQRVYRDHCAGRAEHADLLFAVLSLCWWHRRFG